MTMRCLHWGFCLTTAAFGVPMSATVDQGRREVREEVLSLSAAIEVRRPAYSRVPGDEGFVVFGPGTYVLSIAFSNFTDRPVSFKPNRKDWSEGLSIELKRQSTGDEQSFVSRGARLRRPANQSTQAIARVDARRSISDRFILDTENALEPGEYRITVQLDEDELEATARLSRNILKREIKLRVVDPQSPLERMDQLLQLSTQAMTSGQYVAVRKLAAQVLTLNPQSIAARGDIGDSYLAQKNCAGAKPVLLEAINLLQTGGDPDLKVSQSAREEAGLVIADRLAKQCP